MCEHSITKKLKTKSKKLKVKVTQLLELERMRSSRD